MTTDIVVTFPLQLDRHKHQKSFNVYFQILIGFVTFYVGHAVAQLVEAPRYKPKGRGFDSRWRHSNFSLT